MSKKDIRKIQPNFLDFLKALTSYLKNKNRNTQNFLKLIDKHKVEKSFLFTRAISYNYNKPHIIHYINKYLNNKYEFYNYDIEEFLLSLTFIIDQNNHYQPFFIRAKEQKDPNKYKVKKLLKEYYLIINRKYLNDDELNYLYSLFCQKVISVEEIEKINNLLNGQESKLGLDLDFLESQTNEVTDNQEAVKEYIEYTKTKVLPEEIQNYCNNLINQKLSRHNCQNCRLFDKQMVVLDTSLENIGPVDLMFIALNPGKQEALFHKPLVGDAGKLHREKLYNLPKNISWLNTNILLCSTNNQKDIGKNDKEIKTVCQNCQDFLYQTMKNFPAKVYIPMGKQAIEFFGITGSVTQNSGKPVKQQSGSIVVPLIHPSAVLQSRNLNTPTYNNSWEIIFQIANKLSKKNQSEQTSVLENIHQEVKKVEKPIENTQKHHQYNIPMNKYVSTIDESLTYFDSVNLDDENILNIYIDQEGEKKYNIQSFNVPIYIKNTSLKNRTMLSDQFDYVSYINGRTRYKLAKTLKDNLLKHKNMAITVRSE